MLVYWTIRKIAAIYGRQASPETAVVFHPGKNEIDIRIDDRGQDGMPVITVRSIGATLNIQSIKQESGQYIVSADKQADNVVVIEVLKKT